MSVTLSKDAPYAVIGVRLDNEGSERSRVVIHRDTDIEGALIAGEGWGPVNTREFGYTYVTFKGERLPGSETF